MWDSGTGTHARKCFGLCFARSPWLTATRATAGGPIDGGRGSNGGVWEWTSTVFGSHHGFAGTAVFAGYSSDFFDQNHHVVVSAKPFLIVARAVTDDGALSSVAHTRRFQDWPTGEHCGTSTNTITVTRGRRRGSRMMYSSRTSHAQPRTRAGCM